MTGATITRPRRSAQPPATGRGAGARRILTRVAVFAVIAAVPPLLFDDYWVFMSAQVLAFAVATLGLDILYGRTGQMSLAHASFMGVGAYTTYIVSSYGHGPAIQLGAVVVVALLAALVVAVPTLRLSGLRLALVTLAFGELLAWVIRETTDLTGGTQGASVDPIVIGTWDSSEPLHAYLIALVPAAIATLLAAHLGRTQLGRRMLAVRDTELAAESVGVAVARTKITAFLISAVYAGIAGWLYAAIVGFIAPPDFDLFASVYLFVAVVIGGAGTVLGAWLGAAYIVLVPELFTLAGQPNLYPIVGGALLAVVALLVPDGIVGLGRGLWRRVRGARGGQEGSR
ncbi:branched-chain amino acid transport system permease protein [Micromonospora pattaloongensis]|uniref:Branched-chain amino acid transport system permease protein n=1 Tax=Micromonospora pattaloongensis TaxID=405436 RepID=A0A1H3RYR0_9ACTN|nr:branched-chain amino acid ABC transporter permease [Micromonospora pattaloongensis]SDZ30385.1 branched-chain amino acid transport system permease protein [Micromonospora pattaloongensis]